MRVRLPDRRPCIHPRFPAVVGGVDAASRDSRTELFLGEDAQGVLIAADVDFRNHRGRYADVGRK